jgi:hypothetical protein
MIRKYLNILFSPAALVLLVLAMSVLLLSCPLGFDPPANQDGGSITINLPGISASAASEDESGGGDPQARAVGGDPLGFYRWVLTGPGPSRSGEATQTISIANLVAGSWHIEITAFKDGEPYGKGSLNFTIEAGKATRESIVMNKIITGVTVDPPTKSVIKGQAQQFTVVVKVNEIVDPAQTVTWSILGALDPGTTINASGLLTVALGETAASLIIRAISTVDTAMSGFAVVLPVEANEAKSITAFRITSPVSATGIINEVAKTITLNVPNGTPVTSMAVSITHTGASVSPVSGATVNFAAPQTFTVTALDTTTQVYTVTVEARIPVYYVFAGGNDSNNGLSSAAPLARVFKALQLIRAVYIAGPSSWPMDGPNLAPAQIVIKGNLTIDTGTTNGMIVVSGAGYPPIELKGFGSGADAGVIDATGKNKRVLYIADGNKVILGENLTLTGGNPNTSGGGVFVDGAGFVMTGGTISYNNAPGGANGAAGVYVYGSSGSFTMSGGEIWGNTSLGAGGGVQIFNSAGFVMSGGKIRNNSAHSYGGGVAVHGHAAFTMSGGEILGNAVTNLGGSGGGVGVSNNGTFTMSGGVISGNTAIAGVNSSGGGVFVDHPAAFTMNGGEISDNSTTGYGGGVHVGGSSGSYNGTFKKEPLSGSFSGTIYGNDAGAGLENTAGDDTKGHAVYVNGGPKKRTTTAGTTVSLDSTKTAAAGGWE